MIRTSFACLAVLTTSLPALTVFIGTNPGGKTPRHFKIPPGAKWLLCAHQDSNTVGVLPLDPQGCAAQPRDQRDPR
jgi:6-phosphogluconolactonase (cycloisomerase 2 family)